MTHPFVPPPPNSPAPYPGYGQPSTGGPLQQPAMPYGGSATAPQPSAPKRPRGRGTIAAIAIGAVIAVGIGGVFVGSRLNSGSTNQQTQSAPPPPSADQVSAATIDLCTRFAAAYRAMPVPQNTGLDVIPTLNYIADALRDNGIADSRIREAMETSLRIARDQASYLMKDEATRGAIQPARGWTPEASNAADQKVWDLCRAYGA